MSSTNRTTVRGGKGSKGDSSTKTQKTDKPDPGKVDKNKSGKGSGDKNQSQQNSDSGRGARLKDLRSEDPNIKDKIKTVTELTGRTEEEACFALHEYSNDINQAVNMLIESSEQDWVTSVKKKKNRQASTNKTESNTENPPDDWESPPANTTNDRDKSRTRGSGPPRMRGRAGWRGRENRENEKNLESEPTGRTDGGGGSGHGGGSRRGRISNGPTRGGGSGRGGRGGGRLGSRTFQAREGGNRNTFGNRNTVDTWNSNAVGTMDVPMESWDNDNWKNDFPSPIDDWYNEEYTGSLADTKVFTPSTAQDPPESAEKQPDLVTAHQPASDVSSTSQPYSQPLEARAQQQTVSAGITPTGTAPMVVGSLTASQSQFLSSLSAQNDDSLKGVQGSSFPSVQQFATGQQTVVPPAATVAASNAVSAYNAGGVPEHTGAQQPVRTKTQRARVPPPSKIPSSAVEMPGDLNSSVGYLDVEFGALDLISENNSFDGASDNKFNQSTVPTSGSTNLDNSSSGGQGSTGLDLNTAVSQPSSLDTFSTSPPKPSQSQASISSSLTQNQMLSSGDSGLTQQPSEHLSSAQSVNTFQSRTGVTVSGSGLDIGKQTTDVGHTHSSYPSSSPGNVYPGYQNSKTAASAYQPQSYGSNTYSSSQVTTASSYVSNQPVTANSYTNSNSGSVTGGAGSNYAAPVNSYQNSSYSSVSSYQSASNAFPSMTQASSYQPPTNQSTYQPAAQTHSVYGTGAGLSNASNYNVSGTNQYNSYSTSSTSTHNHKMTGTKEQGYDNSTSVATSTATTTTSVGGAASALGLTSSAGAGAGTKVTNSGSAAKGGVVTNIPAGVAPMMGTQYIMGQAAGMPFYQQPMYSYEELQLLQQRVPPHMGAYYDLGYQTTPTTLPAARDAGLGSASGQHAYAGISTDSRFARSDSNASPVPSTLSTQQQTSTQSAHAQATPMLSATALPPGYAYFYNAAGMMPGSFQYGTPALYSQMPPAATNSTNLSQYPKPSNYGSTYGTGYDALSQSTPDYAKSGYVGGTQQQNKAQAVAGSAVTTGSSVATDLSAMYGKSHAALGKVNSYEKQGFHSGTPPPFNLAGNQSTGIAPNAAYGATQMYIPPMPHQQHHSTTLMHQPLHQMDIRHQARRMESGNSSGQRSQTSSQAKTGAKQSYPNSYWNNA